MNFTIVSFAVPAFMSSIENLTSTMFARKVMSGVCKQAASKITIPKSMKGKEEKKGVTHFATA
jgi:hypothetical protein